jgi:hypothetical protein
VSRVLYIAPVNVEGGHIEREVEDAARSENDVAVLWFSRGPRHVEYHYYETLVLPDNIHTNMEVERLPRSSDASKIMEGSEFAGRLPNALNSRIS